MSCKIYLSLFKPFDKEVFQTLMDSSIFLTVNDQGFSKIDNFL